MPTNIKQVIYWAVAAMALIALADPYPQLATILVVLLIAGVVLTHYKTFTPFLQAPK